MFRFFLKIILLLKTSFTLFFLSLTFQFLFFIHLALAEGQFATASLVNPLQATTIEELLAQVTNFILILGGSLATISILFGGFRILTSAGDYEKLETGRRFIMYGVIAIFVLLMARLVVALIEQIFK